MYLYMFSFCIAPDFANTNDNDNHDFDDDDDDADNDYRHDDDDDDDDTLLCNMYHTHFCTVSVYRYTWAGQRPVSLSPSTSTIRSIVRKVQATNSSNNQAMTWHGHVFPNICHASGFKYWHPVYGMGTTSSELTAFNKFYNWNEML